MAARCRAGCEEKYAPLINALLAEKKCAAAADLQAKMEKDINEAEAKALIAGHEGAESVGAREATAVAARARRRAAVKEQYAPKIDTLLVAKDYAAAARLQEQMETRIKDEEAGARLPSAAGHGRIAEAKARRRAEYDREIAAMVAARSYTAAAALQSELLTAAGEWNARAGPRWRTRRTWPPSCRSSPEALQPFGHRRRPVRSNPSATGHDSLPPGQQTH